MAERIDTTAKGNNGFQEFGGAPQFISVGGLDANATVGNTTAETALMSVSIPAITFNKTTQQFNVKLGGTIGSDGSRDVTLTLRYGSTDVLAIATVSLPDEDDKAFELEFNGRIHTTGATGKIVATGKLKNSATGMADIVASTAVGGATVDLTAAGSLNVTAEWDGSAATATMTAHIGRVELFN